MQPSLILLYSHILLRWVQPDDPTHGMILNAMDASLRERLEFCYTSQNLSEFWNVSTSPTRSNGFGLTPKETDLRTRAIEAKFHLLEDIPAVHREWRRLLVAHSISGVQVHDARLVASMHVHGVGRILTFNTRDFARFPGVAAVHPQDLAS